MPKAFNAMLGTAQPARCAWREGGIVRCMVWCSAVHPLHSTPSLFFAHVYRSYLEPIALRYFHLSRHVSRYLHLSYRLSTKPSFNVSNLTLGAIVSEVKWQVR